MLKKTSKVRDIDIVSGRLSTLESDPGVDLLLDNLADEREDRVDDAIKVAWRLFENREPRVDRGEFRGGSGWYRRSLADLERVLQRELPIVVENEDAVDELHSLRKHAKDLRYLLELLPLDRRPSRLTALLRSWQDELGAVGDSDIIIEYLEKARQSGQLSRSLPAERSLRQRRYRAFADSFSNESERAFPVLLSSALEGGERLVPEALNPRKRRG